MPEDASLDAFAAGDEDAETEADESAPRADADGSADAPEASAAERTAAADPATSTYTWSPDGGECAACGASVERRWRDGDDLVCVDCKEW